MPKQTPPPHSFVIFSITITLAGLSLTGTQRNTASAQPQQQAPTIAQSERERGVNRGDSAGGAWLASQRLHREAIMFRHHNISAWLLSAALASGVYPCSSSCSIVAAQDATSMSAESSRGVGLYEQGNDKAAIKSLISVTKKNKQDVKSWYYLGLAQKRFGNQTCFHDHSDRIQLHPLRKFLREKMSAAIRQSKPQRSFVVAFNLMQRDLNDILLAEF